MSTDFFAYGAPAPQPPTSAAVPTTAPAATPVRAVLADLADEDWEALIGFAARRRHGAGALIVAAGDRAAALHFVARGQVQVNAPGQAAQVRGEGELIGALSFLDGAPSHVQAVAVGEVELLRLDAEALTRLAAWQPRIAIALLRDLGAHVAARLRTLQPAD